MFPSGSSAFNNFNLIMDISILFKMAAIGLIVTVITQILKKTDRDDIAMLVGIVGMVIALGIVVGLVGDPFDKIGEIFGLNLI